MKVLLDTNIIIHREANRVIVREIGTLFNWLDKLHYEKYIHPLSRDEIKKHKDSNVVNTFEIKLDSYHTLPTLAPETLEITAIRAKFDKNDNDTIDTSLLKEVFSNRVDFLITEDRKVHEKARELKISSRVFTIDGFLEKVVVENPSLVEYKVLAVKKEFFGNIDISDPFFDSFKRDYPGFETWFIKKSPEIAYICKADNNDMLAFLYIKIEDINEDYSSIEPKFAPRKRLKIGTFKVILNGFKLGERFLKIVFDNAINYKVDEIYVTIFDHTEDQQRLINLMEDWGFYYHGTKSGTELVYVRDSKPKADISNPCLTYPYLSKATRKFIVPIRPEYHTELMPDSFLKTESPANFVENRPNRNAISKVYISRSIDRDLEAGDIIVFYRTKADSPAHYGSVATTIGVVQSVIRNISNAQKFVELCRKRSVFSDQELIEQWNLKPNYRPFIVNFLYVYTLPKKINLKTLKESNIISDAPRGFERLTDGAFNKLMEISNADKRLIVD